MGYLWFFHVRYCLLLLKIVPLVVFPNIFFPADWPLQPFEKMKNVYAVIGLDWEDANGIHINVLKHSANFGKKSMHHSVSTLFTNRRLLMLQCHETFCGNCRSISMSIRVHLKIIQLSSNICRITQIWL